jgi:hypothetical protein
MFVPEQMTHVEIFSLFHDSTYEFGPQTTKKINGIINHFRKATCFEVILKDIFPKLQIDREQLDATGFTPAEHSYQIASLFESQILELYSSLDCLTSILYHIFKSTRGFPDSTRKIFKRISEGSIGDDFPTELRDLFLRAKWFAEILHLRDELTHANTGSCYYDQESGTLRYFHDGIKRGNQPLAIDDAIEWIRGKSLEIQQFTNDIFAHLCTTLAYKEKTIFCGIFHGRMYMRYLGYSENLTIQSGRCYSRTWFDSPSEPDCPFKNDCGAYAVGVISA